MRSWRKQRSLNAKEKTTKRREKANGGKKKRKTTRWSNARQSDRKVGTRWRDKFHRTVVLKGDANQRPFKGILSKRWRWPRWSSNWFRTYPRRIFCRFFALQIARHRRVNEGWNESTIRLRRRGTREKYFKDSTIVAYFLLFYQKGQSLCMYLYR